MASLFFVARWHQRLYHQPIHWDLVPQVHNVIASILFHKDGSWFNTDLKKYYLVICSFEQPIKVLKSTLMCPIPPKLVSSTTIVKEK
jgi:hypothetical protein